jgi:hypothetical protein
MKKNQENKAVKKKFTLLRNLFKFMASYVSNSFIKVLAEFKKVVAKKENFDGINCYEKDLNII